MTINRYISTVDTIIKLKVKTMEFYLKLYRNVENELAKEMLKALAEDKKKNINDLLKAKEKFKNIFFKPNFKRHCESCWSSIPEILPLIENKNIKNMNELHILNIALSIEIAFYNFFATMCESCKFELKELYKNIAKKDEEHIKLIKKILNERGRDD